MAIPSIDSYLITTLKNFPEGKELRSSDIATQVADQLGLSEEERQEKLASGGFKHNNLIRWSLVFLSTACLLERVQRGLYKITPRGLDYAAHNTVLTMKGLHQFPEYHLWRSGPGRPIPAEKAVLPAPASIPSSSPEPSESPEETIERSMQTINAALSSELLEAIKKNSPNFFEQLVVDLMLALGYGGSMTDAGKAFKTTNDEGIDGVIKEDRLGLSNIYLQAKRWKEDRTVGRPQIQEFVGALMGRHATRGVFITTSKFSSGAIEYAKHLPQPVILIDGEKLVQLMIEYNVGVTTRQTYEVKRLDLDYFSEDE